MVIASSPDRPLARRFGFDPDEDEAKRLAATCFDGPEFGDLRVPRSRTTG